jgi:glycosyltransferase 2 family protein
MKQDSASRQRSTKNWLSIVGTILVLISFYYIGIQLWGYRETLETWTPTTKSIVAIGISTFIYALANYLLAAAWIQLLRLCGEQAITWKRLTQIYGKSQIGKYIPGNIAHIAGRHAMGRVAGASHGHLAIASIYEIVGLISAALIITLLGGRSVLDQLTSLSWLNIILPLILVAYLFTPRLLQRLRPDTQNISPLFMLMPLGYYCLFFLASGAALGLIGIYMDSFTMQSDHLLILSAFAISWSVGFVTPGAPSGIGIREAALMLLLTPITGDEGALILALLFRLVTIGGDVIFYLLSQLSSNTSESTTPP